MEGKKYYMSELGVKFSEKNKCGYNLTKAEKILEMYNENYSYNDINTILEFYNIYLCLEHGCYLPEWTEDVISQYKKVSKKFNENIGRFFSTINDDNIISIYSKVKNEYCKDFWILFEKYKVYQAISNERFKKLIDGKIDLSIIIVHKAIVKEYDEVIANVMMKNIRSCELLLDEYLTLKKSNNKYYFPSHLNKEEYILKYINFVDVNINYLKLISNFSGSELNLSDKIRLKAKKEYKNHLNVLLEKRVFMKYGAKVSFDDTQRKLVEIKFEDNQIAFSYSKIWFKENLEYDIILIYNFIHNFGFVDNQIRFMHVHKLHLVNVFELYSTRGKKEYITDIIFNHCQMIAQCQMHSYYNFLKNEDIILEEVYKWFFEEYLKTEYNVNGFYFNAPSKDTTYLEKNRTLNSELDNILKQFKMWCEDKNIDLELLQISSNQMFFKDIPSLINKKYIYPNSDEFTKAACLLCSDHIRCISDEYTQSKFHDLININNLKIEDFYEYHYDDIKWLIDHYYIYENDEGFLKNDLETFWIIDELYLNDVLSYHHLDKNKQQIVDIFLEKGILKYENSLFSKPEYDYLNFIFNKRDFSNGLDLRNKYIHGTQSTDATVQQNDYYIILRMFILCILKINDEFCLEYEIENLE